MALVIKKQRIVGKINNLQEKLNGELPINRLELLYLINSWGRISSFDTNDNIKITKCKATQSEQALLVRKECYDLSKLDTSEITDMSQLFQWSEFNGDISNWDVSNVTNMNKMFYLAKKFNQALNNWDVSNVTNMDSVFCFSNFNGDISNWDVSNVTDMCGMFAYTTSFNQALNSWDVSNVTDIGFMFANANNFNQALDNWDVSKVTNMYAMFSHAIAFNQALDNWDVSNVTTMYEMFYRAKEFNQALDNWDVSKVTTMYGMFYGTTSFNQNINSWIVSNVTNMYMMFRDAIAFETKFNNGNSLPYYTSDLKQWLEDNRDKMLAIETLNKESTPEYKMAIIENKISNNKTTLDELFKEKNIEPNSKIGLELLKVYNDTHDKLKKELEDLKTQVVDIATNDFNSL